MEENPTRDYELLVGPDEVEVLGVDDEADSPLECTSRRGASRLVGVRRGAVAQENQPGELGRPARLRAPGAPHLARVALALPDGELFAGVLHRRR